MSNEITLQENKILEEKTKSHPCYSGGCQNARIHLPIAPLCNISCNYCNRKYDCVNESRPGVTSEVLNPSEALERFKAVRSKINNLKVVGIAGPGDALANFESTKKTLELIRKEDPDVTFCLSTNGLMLPYYATDLVKLGVTHVTVTVNTLDPKVGAKIYKYINFMGVKLEGEKGAEVLINNQIAGIKLLISMGIITKINTVMIKGVNDIYIEEMVKKVKELGVFINNIMPLIPAPGSAFENMPLTSNKELNELRAACEVHLKQMYHCKQCRADAIGSLDHDCSIEFSKRAKEQEINKDISEPVSFRFAVATKSGTYIDEHFGHVKEFYVYSYEDGKVSLLEKRPVDKYCAGSDCDEENKLTGIVGALSDCDAILVQRIGYVPQKELEGKGKKVIQTIGVIEDEIIKHAQSLKIKEKAVAAL
ncbi:MAG TPA: nitrogenase cofactor biosynthesis protein NifB [Clostridia bacterium]